MGTNDFARLYVIAPARSFLNLAKIGWKTPKLLSGKEFEFQ